MVRPLGAKGGDREQKHCATSNRERALSLTLDFEMRIQFPMNVFSQLTAPRLAWREFEIGEASDRGSS
jgi:hypothetical protein